MAPASPTLLLIADFKGRWDQDVPRLPVLSEGWRKEQEKFTARGAAHPDPLMGWGGWRSSILGTPPGPHVPRSPTTAGFISGLCPVPQKG